MPRHIANTGNRTPIDNILIERGMTRKQLSDLCGVPVRTLQGWSARDRKAPNVYQLYKVSKALGCHMEDLIELPPEQEQPE